MSDFEKLYNSACGIVGISKYDESHEFAKDLYELENNPDFTFIGRFELTQDADEELEYQGFTLDQITKMSLNQYGDVIDCLLDPDTQTYWVYVGAR